jgi:hypothetical protein
VSILPHAFVHDFTAFAECVGTDCNFSFINSLLAIRIALDSIS